jgi:uncharacterized RDD family membrane protein YckC
MTTADEYISKVLDMMPRATPMRSQIATELRGHIVERVGHGQPLDDVLRHLGDPVMLAESYLAAVPLVSAPFWRRACAKVVDLLAVLACCVPVLWLASRTESGLFFALVFGILASSLLFGVYTIVAEHWIGQTLGKRLFDIRVVRESGTRIGVGQAIVRQLPAFLQVFWIDVFFALFTDKSQRAFELLSKTRVVVTDPDEDA